MTIWFTSDYHFNHDKIIEYSKRPFKSLEHMHEVIINNHNSRVKKDDTVFFLGDFCFEDKKNRVKNFINKLNGKLIFIKGNHDCKNKLKTPILGMIIELGGYFMFLTHDPDNYEPSCPINLVGHVHTNWKSKRLKDGTILINVGVDVWNFQPIKIEDIIKQINKHKTLE